MHGSTKLVSRQPAARFLPVPDRGETATFPNPPFHGTLFAGICALEPRAPAWETVSNIEHHVSASQRLSRRSLLGGAIGAVATSCLHGSIAASESEEATIERIIGSMTIEERLGQLFFIQATGVEMTPWYRDLLLTVQPGGILFFGHNIGTAQQVQRYIFDIQRTGRWAPPMIAVDQEGGPVTRIPGDPVPGANQLGSMSDKLVREFAIDRATFLREFGFNVNFAPVADVAYSPYSSMVYRSFGSDPETVSSKITAVVSGSRRGRIASAAKHFPGHGRTPQDSHFDLPVVDIGLGEWQATDAVPFQAGIEVGCEMVMFGHLMFPQWDQAPTSLSRTAVEVLRQEMEFDGIALTDDLTMGALTPRYTPYELVEQSLVAGMDMIMYTSSPVHYLDLIAHLRDRIRMGTISEQQVDESVARVFRLKTRWFPHLAVPL